MRNEPKPVQRLSEGMVKVFESDGKQLRAMWIDGKPWFVAKDVAEQPDELRKYIETFQGSEKREPGYGYAASG